MRATKGGPLIFGHLALANSCQGLREEKQWFLTGIFARPDKVGNGQTTFHKTERHCTEWGKVLSVTGIDLCRGSCYYCLIRWIHASNGPVSLLWGPKPYTLNPNNPLLVLVFHFSKKSGTFLKTLNPPFTELHVNPYTLKPFTP